MVVLERTNARELTREFIPDTPHWIVCDASFTRLSYVLPAIMGLVSEQAVLIALIKPQFEVARHEVGEGGIVRDPALHQRVCIEVQEWVNTQTGWQSIALTPSPILGTEGNKEFLLYATYRRPE